MALLLCKQGAVEEGIRAGRAILLVQHGVTVMRPLGAGGRRRPTHTLRLGGQDGLQIQRTHSL